MAGVQGIGLCQLIIPPELEHSDMWARCHQLEQELSMNVATTLTVVSAFFGSLR
jgi:hypothetical protein